MLSKAMTLRTAPFLKFHIDEGLKKEMAVLDLLRKVEEENAQKPPISNTTDSNS
jgi:ribosome-binding factor A